MLDCRNATASYKAIPDSVNPKKPEKEKSFRVKMVKFGVIWGSRRYQM
jgi:hypothetical protein